MREGLCSLVHPGTHSVDQTVPQTQRSICLCTSWVVGSKSYTTTASPQPICLLCQMTFTSLELRILSALWRHFSSPTAANPHPLMYFLPHTGNFPISWLFWSRDGFLLLYNSIIFKWRKIPLCSYLNKTSSMIKSIITNILRIQKVSNICATYWCVQMSIHVFGQTHVCWCIDVRMHAYGGHKLMLIPSVVTVHFLLRQGL